MNRDLILSLMTDSFKRANVSMAVEQGMNKEQVESGMQQMHSSIEKCMGSVLDSLLENFPDLIK